MEFWGAVSSIGVYFAAIVALIPIFHARSARKAKARNLRMRVSTKIYSLKPSWQAISRREANVPDYIVLSGDDLEITHRKLEGLMAESEVLTPKEQDRLSGYLANLELMVPLYHAGKLTSEMAGNLELLGDRAINELEENGLTYSEPYQPWSTGSQA